MSCKCQNCNIQYKMDLIIPDELWSQISPSKVVGAGMLCPICIVKKIEEISGYSCYILKENNDK